MAIAMPVDQIPNETRTTTPKGRVREARLTDGDRNGALALHVAFLVGLLLTPTVVIPLFILVPLIIWLVRRDSSAFVDDHGRETVNFGISYLLFSLLLVWTVVVPVALFVVAIVNTIRAAVAASNGEYFRYPVTIRFIS